MSELQAKVTEFRDLVDGAISDQVVYFDKKGVTPVSLPDFTKTASYGDITFQSVDPGDVRNIEIGHASEHIWGVSAGIRTLPIKKVAWIGFTAVLSNPDRITRNAVFIAPEPVGEIEVASSLTTLEQMLDLLKWVRSPQSSREEFDRLTEFSNEDIDHLTRQFEVARQEHQRLVAELAKIDEISF